MQKVNITAKHIGTGELLASTRCFEDNVDSRKERMKEEIRRDYGSISDESIEFIEDKIAA